jgi:hypothetical protein
VAKISLKGVAVGGIVDVVATNIAAIPLIAYAMRSIDLTHAPRDQATAAVLAAIHASPGLGTAQFLIGTACSAFGGYVAAWLAKHDELLNGALSAWFCIASGLYGLASVHAASDMVWLQAADFVLAPAAGLAGGYLRRVQARNRRTSTAGST